MTLCMAWVRQTEENEELIFATDSCLTGGEKWNTGIKLFELPRKDCLLCFAGSTFRAYPLILNLISSIKFDEKLINPKTDIKEVLDYLTELFTDLVSNIINEIPTQDIHQIRAEATFLFGGWSWKKQQYCIWKLFYSKDANGFIFEEIHLRPNRRLIEYIGDEIETAKKLYRQEFDDENFDKPMDMEPLKVLTKMIRDSNIRSIDGAIQIAKVYQSGNTEFFGVMWPSTSGKHTFLGREFNNYNRPDVKYIDPDTASIIEDELPEKIMELKDNVLGNNKDFLLECYPENILKDNLSTKDKIKLHTILKDIAYKKFLEDMENAENEAGGSKDE